MANRGFWVLHLLFATALVGLSYANAYATKAWPGFWVFLLVVAWVGLLQLAVGAQGYVWAPGSSFNIDPLMRLAPIHIGLRFQHLARGLGRMFAIVLSAIPGLALWFFFGGDAASALAILALLANIGVITLSFGFIGTAVSTGRGAMTVSRVLTLAYILPTFAYFITQPPLPRWHAPTVLLAHMIYDTPVDWPWVTFGSLLPAAAFVFGARLLFGARELEVRGVPVEHWLAEVGPTGPKPTYRERARRRELWAVFILSALALFYLVFPFRLIVAIVVVFGTIGGVPTIMRRSPGFAKHAALLLLGTSGRSLLLGQHVRRSVHASLVMTLPACFLLLQRVINDGNAWALLVAVPCPFVLGIAAGVWTNPVPADTFSWATLFTTLLKLTPPVLVLGALGLILYVQVITPSGAPLRTEVLIYAAFLLFSLIVLGLGCVNVAVRQRPG